MAYATVDDVASGFRDLTATEKERCTALLDEAAIIVDAYNANASDDAKKVVSCRMVRRQLGYDGDGSGQFPMGSTQGTVSAMGYSQSWTMGGGSSGELYLNKLEKKLLGCGNRIGSYSPVEELV